LDKNIIPNTLKIIIPSISVFLMKKILWCLRGYSQKHKKNDKGSSGYKEGETEKDY